jgi:hypothetical protein
MCQFGNWHFQTFSKYYNRPVRWHVHLRAWENLRASALRRFRWKRNDGESKRIVAFLINTVYSETN